jgi:hypothetical protein
LILLIANSTLLSSHFCLKIWTRVEKPVVFDFRSATLDHLADARHDRLHPLTGFRRTNQIDNAPQLRLFFSYAVLDFRLPKRRHTPPGEYHNDSTVFNWLFQSSSVAEAAYQCNWYLFNAKAKRGLTLLIMNSQQGISMCGAGIVVMDNRVIVKVIHHHRSSCFFD